MIYQFQKCVDRAWSILTFLAVASLLVGCSPSSSTPATSLNGFQTVTSFGTYSVAPKGLTASAVQSDDKLVVVGYGTAAVESGSTADALMMARYTPAGSLDTSFGTNGVVALRFTSITARAEAVKILSNGKLLVAGQDATGTAFVAKFNSDGSPDTTFGTEGAAFYTSTLGGTSVKINDLDTQSDGKIVLVGYATDGVAQKYFYILRFTAAGAIDVTFDTDGIATYTVAGGAVDWIANEVAIQSDDKIVVAGERADFTAIGVIRLAASNGALDTTFDGDGKQTNATFVRARGMSILSTGEIVIAGDDNTNLGLIRFTAIGALDTSVAGGYANTGYALAPASAGVTAYAMTVLGDGSALVAGTPNGNFGLAKFAADGSMVAAFNGDANADGVIEGPVTGVAGISDDESLGGLSVLSNGKIFVAGAVDTSGGQWAMALYTAVGALDTTFDSDGYTTYATSFILTGSSEDEGRALAVQGEKTIVVGTTYIHTSADMDFLVARYTQAGALDTTFGTAGKTIIDFGDDDFAYSVAVDSTDRIIVVGYSDTFVGGVISVARLTEDGVLDTTFDGDGIATYTLAGGDSYGMAVAIDSSGRILIAGYDPDGGGLYSWVAVRLTSAGALDTTFAGDGTREIDFGNADMAYPKAIAIQDDGKIVIVGNAGPPTFAVFAVVRLLATGASDTTFSTDGIVTTDVGAGLESTALSVTLQADGKIVVGGSTTAAGHDNYFVVARYTSVGVLDASFSSDGIVVTLLGNAAWLGYYHGGASGIGLDSTNRIIAAGYSLDSGSTVVTVARYTAAGVLDTSFADSGISRTVVGSSTLSLSNGMIVEAGGNILLAGTVWSYYADGGYGSFGSDVLLKRIEP